MAVGSALRQINEREAGALLNSVLEFINRARRALKISPVAELPRGVPEKSRLCVLARALKCEVLLDDEDNPFALLPNYRKAGALAAAWGVGKPEEAWNGWSVALPPQLTWFVHQFDARRHPELIMRDVRVRMRLAGAELEELRQRRAQLRSLRLRVMRTQARTSVLVSQGRELCLRSIDVCARSRQLTRAAHLSSGEPPARIRRAAAASFAYRVNHIAAPACPASLMAPSPRDMAKLPPLPGY